jgi:hypothetical protein
MTTIAAILDAATAHDAARPLDATRTLNFSGSHILARAASDPGELRIDERTIVVNVGTQPIQVDGLVSTPIRPLTSTILDGATITGGDLVVLLTVREERNIGAVITDPGWPVYESLLAQQMGSDAALAAAFPPATPLFRSPQDTIGEVKFDPAVLLGQSETTEMSKGTQSFTVKVNLWFAPGGTDCAVHNQHDFIEVHTQVHGEGRMQKFRDQSIDSLYQDIRMSPGYTTEQPFCQLSPEGGFVYPWHQYRSDTDCIWLAVEYHRR